MKVVRYNRSATYDFKKDLNRSKINKIIIQGYFCFDLNLVRNKHSTNKHYIYRIK